MDQAVYPHFILGSNGGLLGVIFKISSVSVSDKVCLHIDISKMNEINSMIYFFFLKKILRSRIFSRRASRLLYDAFFMAHESCVPTCTM